MPGKAHVIPPLKAVGRKNVATLCHFRYRGWIVVAGPPLKAWLGAKPGRIVHLVQKEDPQAENQIRLKCIYFPPNESKQSLFTFIII